MRSALLSPLVLAATVACGSPVAAPAPASSLPQLPPPGTDPAVTPPEGAVAAFPDAPDPALTPIDKPAHEKARAAAVAGNWHEAKRLFGKLAFAYPEHPILIAQYNAVAAHIERAQAAAKAALETLPLHVPPSPPAKYTLFRAAPTSSSKLVTLRKKSEKPNGITDDERWFEQNDLRLPSYWVERPGGMLWAPALLSALLAVELKTSFFFVDYEPSRQHHADTMPLEIPPAYGSLTLVSAVDSKPYLVAIYGNRVVVTFDASRKVVSVIDLIKLSASASSVTGQAKVGEVSLTTAEGTQTANLTVETQSIELHLRYALAADGVLYVSHFHNGYTKEAKGESGYLTALDLATGEVLWRSAPQVCNAENFILLEGGIVCGYGFTSEKRWLTITDRATGVTKQKMEISTTADWFVPKGDSVHVLGYRADFVFVPK